MKKQFKVTLDVMFFIIFLILKLDGIINWKWIWVFSPFWIVWIVEICIDIVMWIASWELKHKSPYAIGDPLVWDAKTNTLYGPWSAEENENTEE